MNSVMIGTLIASMVAFSAPLVLAALGGLFSERSGVINIGLEGKMLSAACATAYISDVSNNAYLGLLCGIVVAVLLAIVHTVLTQFYRIDHIISGMGINALALGATSLITKTFPADRMTELPKAFYWIAGWTFVVAVWWILNKSRPGLRLLAVGNDPDKSRQMGINPVTVRFNALLMTGVLTGLAGAFIATNNGIFTENMTSGRGYIALAALILGGWRPVQTFLACLMFGFFDALQLQLQGQAFWGVTIPNEFWSALPYIATLLALAGFVGKYKAPSGLGKA